MPVYYSPLNAFIGDSRDYIYVAPSVTLPPSVDWRWAIVDIENQGIFGSCTANAVVGACELILSTNGKFNHLSRLFNYYESRLHGGLPIADDGSGNKASSGAYTRDAVAAAQKVGLPLESLWHYLAENVNTKPSDAAYSDALNRMMNRYELIDNNILATYDPNGNMNITTGQYKSFPFESSVGKDTYIRDMKSALNEGYPLVIGMPVNLSFEYISGDFDTQASNPWLGITTADPAIAGHALCIVGYDDLYQAFIVMNSWGGLWGNNGCALLPYNTIKDIYEAWVVKGFQGYKLIPPSNSNGGSTTFVSLIVDPKYDIPPNPNPSVDPYAFFGVTIMAVTSTDLKWRKSNVVSAVAANNGGTMNYTSAGAITSNVKNNLFPDVSQVERTAGAVCFRKLFLHVDKVSQDELLNARISLAGVTPAGDFVAFYAGTKNDTEATLDVSRPYGVGLLSTGAAAGDTSLTFTPENEAWYTSHTPFRVGDLVCVSDGTNSDYVVVSAVTYGATVALTVGALPHAFSSGAVVASVYSVASTKASYTTPAVTSATGVFNDTANLIVNDRGTVDDVWTLTFTSSTAFTIAGTVSGTVGVGTVGSGATPTYNGGANTYFQINSTGFSGTFAAGNTIVFSTFSAAIPIWMQRIVPSGTADISTDSTSLTVAAESY